MEAGGVATFNQGPSTFRAPGSFMSHGPRMGGFRPSGPPGFRPRFPLGDALAYDGKRMRNKTVMRKTVDYNASVMAYVENRMWQRDQRDQRALQTDQLYLHTLQPPTAMLETPLNGACTRFVRQATNKIKCPIFCVVWTPEGRRLITGASSGEFTLWNGLTFNFETILQAHDTSVRAMVWSHNDNWMLTADHAGFIKYWQSNMNNVKMYQAHKDPVRGLRLVCYHFVPQQVLLIFSIYVVSLAVAILVSAIVACTTMVEFNVAKQSVVEIPGKHVFLQHGECILLPRKVVCANG